ncbi:hypothetical protein ABW21_db0206403 [Orbilia brochopaga]|nr:hypothetical protein ABW21_db0206403 [Drechslerella brochopaga]
MIFSLASLSRRLSSQLTCAGFVCRSSQTRRFCSFNWAFVSFSSFAFLIWFAETPYFFSASARRACWPILFLRIFFSAGPFLTFFFLLLLVEEASESESER